MQKTLKKTLGRIGTVEGRREASRAGLGAAGWGLLLLAALGAVLAGPPAALAQEDGSGTVTGVLQVGGVPQVGVQVVASSSNSSSFESAETSDAAGQFTFEAVPLGTVYVKCYGPEDELVAEGEVELTTDGQTVTVELAPVP